MVPCGPLPAPSDRARPTTPLLAPSLTANALIAVLPLIHLVIFWARAPTPLSHAAASLDTTLLYAASTTHLPQLRPACSNGGCFTIMDATAKRDAPDTVYDTRLPVWLLPDVPASTRAKMRPDILLIAGLPVASVRLGVNKRLSTPALKTLQRNCAVHVIEVGYCSESSATST